MTQMVKTACNLVDPDLIPGWGRFPGEGNGNPLQYSCLENSMDRGAWRATDHGVAKIWTWLSHFHSHRDNLVLPYDMQQHILQYFTDVSLFFCPQFILSKWSYGMISLWGWGVWKWLKVWLPSNWSQWRAADIDLSPAGLYPSGCGMLSCFVHVHSVSLSLLFW